MSVAKITDRGNMVIFKKHVALIKDPNNNNVKMVAERIGNLYYIKESDNFANKISFNENSQINLWHERTVHLNKVDLVGIIRNKSAVGLNFDTNSDFSKCEICLLGKQHIDPFLNNRKQCSTLLEIIHTDICGPIKTETKGEARYFAIFIDDHSRWCEVHLLKRKNEVLDVFKKYKNMAENYIGQKIKRI